MNARTVIFTSDAEQAAREAQALPAFDGINLLNVKRSVAEILTLVGKQGIFDEYTRHDISHVDGMLALLEWVVPAETKAAMSPADWLLTVLAIYLHDVGMLVTRKEFEGREVSGFPAFRDDLLSNEDYRVRVTSLDPDASERFLYQEFVRAHHPDRIKAWIVGKAPEVLGVTHDVMDELSLVLQPLTDAFRRDLAFVCESHHFK